MATKYEILVKAILDTTNLQSQINNLSATKAVKIRGSIELDQTGIDAQVQKWNNQIARMTSNKSINILNTDKVKKDFEEINYYINRFQTNLGSQSNNVNKVNQSIDNLRTNVQRLSDVEAQQSVISRKANTEKLANIQQQILLLKQLDQQTKQELAGLEKRNIQLHEYKNKLANLQTANKKAFETPAVQDALSKYQAVFNQVKNGTANMNQLKTAFSDFNVVLKKNADNVFSFGDMFGIAIKKMILWAAAAEVIYGTQKQIGEGVQYIRDFNKEMTNIQIVTNANSVEIENMGRQFNNLAKELGATTLEVAKGSLEWINC